MIVEPRRAAYSVPAAGHQADAAGMARRKLRFLRSMRLIRRPVRKRLA